MMLLRNESLVEEMARRSESLTNIIDRDLGRAIKILRHPAQLATIENVTVLLDLLDSCEDAAELYDFQVRLFHLTYEVQEAHDLMRRSARRVLVGKQPTAPNDWPLICSASSTSADDWDLECDVAERIVRQLRTVGDALAWRVFHFDRRAIIALSQNSPPGPFVGKTGLDYELGAIQSRYRSRGNFTLLHDLTSVVRIGDVTECHANGYRELDEIKSNAGASAHAKRHRQMRRAQQAIASIVEGGPLPIAPNDPAPATQHLWLTQVRYRSDSNRIGDLAESAAKGAGWAVQSIGQGRVLAFMDIASAARAPDAEKTWEAFARRRAQAIDRVGRDRQHLLRATSADTASRQASIAPYSIFRLPADLRAKLICDHAVVETYVAADRLCAALQGEGCHVELLLPKSNSTIEGDVAVFAASRRDRRLLMHAQSVSQVLFELLDVSRWAAATRELLDEPQPQEHPVMTFSAERDYWTRPLPAPS